MKFMEKCIFTAYVFTFALFVSACLSGCRTVETLPPPSHTNTEWHVKISCGLDTLCLLNGLTGDTLSLQRMGADIAFWKGKLNPEERESLDFLTRWRKETRTPVHSLVLKPFTAAGADSLQDVIDLCDSPGVMREALLDIQDECRLRNTYYDEEGYIGFAAHLPYLKSVLEGLERCGFDEYWEESVKPGLSDQAARLTAYVRGYNIVPEVEKALGFSLPSGTVTFYLCEYLQPYGNHVLPGVFATETKIPDEHAVRTAIHELLHNPCYNYDPRFWHTADLVWKDDFIRTRFEKRDPAWGYNTFGDYYVEDAVRALEQHISMRLGIAVPLSRRFGPEEGGDHVLAAVFFELMTRHGFGETGEGFREFIIRMGKEGVLSNGELKTEYAAYMDRTH